MSNLNQPIVNIIRMDGKSADIEKELPIEDVQWCLRQWRMIRLGGVWGVPRSGLIFRKTDLGFELDQVMPYTSEMAAGAVLGMNVPATAEELLAYQKQDFGCIQKRFEAAGLEFTDPAKLLGGPSLDDLQKTADATAKKLEK